VGIANILAPVHPYRARDARVAARVNATANRLFLDPIFRGRYPKGAQPLFGLLNRKIRPGDFELMAAPVDFLGVNYYTRHVARRYVLPLVGFKFMKPIYDDVVFTDVDWEVYPHGLAEMLRWVKTEYGNPEVYVTENGAAFADRAHTDRVADRRRIRYLKSYLLSLKEALNAGCRVRGYFVWSLLDNFEWSYGLSKRFGLIYVDYETQKRIPKQSYYWYRQLCRRNWFAL
jgi:beta-glucosidase